MKISQAAIASGVTVKAIRHYEAKGLLDKMQRRGKYRDFSSSDVERLRLIARCRRLGFGVTEVKRVLGLVLDARPECPAPEAMLAVVGTKLRVLRTRIGELQHAEQQLTETFRYLQERASQSGA
jgi:MerR family copper efflux transcriptional regulator